MSIVDLAKTKGMTTKQKKAYLESLKFEGLMGKAVKGKKRRKKMLEDI
jgi:hypothetical protein